MEGPQARRHVTVARSGAVGQLIVRDRLVAVRGLCKWRTMGKS